MLLFIIGLASGIIGGMGMGGGTILIPALILFTDISQHIAQSVNLAVFFPTSIVALWIHIKNKRVKYRLAIKIIVVGLIGAFIGSRIAITMETQVLKKFFGVFILVMGIYELFRKSKNKD